MLFGLFKKPMPSSVMATSLYSTVVRDFQLVAGPPKDSDGTPIFTDEQYRLLLLGYLWGILSLHGLKGVQMLLAISFVKERYSPKSELEIGQKAQDVLRECVKINQFLRDSDLETAGHFYFEKKLDRRQMELICGSFMADHKELVEFIGAMMKKFKIVDPPGVPW